MIRRILDTVYRKTVGALWSLLKRTALSAANRWGALQVIYILVIVALMAGFVNAVVLPVPNQTAAVYPTTGAQSIPETFIDGMVILLGAAGIYLTYMSGRQTTKSRMVNLYLSVALLLILISTMTGLYLVNLKG
jgi:uncharacterized membrane protein YcfT